MASVRTYVPVSYQLANNPKLEYWYEPTSIYDRHSSRHLRRPKELCIVVFQVSNIDCAPPRYICICVRLSDQAISVHC
jgi:hypothetical protein